MPDITAADVYALNVRGRRGNALRTWLGIVLSIAFFTEIDLTRYYVVITRRDTGQAIGVLDLGRGQAASYGAGELMREKAAHMSPASFLKEYSLAP